MDTKWVIDKIDTLYPDSYDLSYINFGQDIQRSDSQTPKKMWYKGHVQYNLSSIDRRIVWEDESDPRELAPVMDIHGSWEEHLPLVEYVYNNSYQTSIGMTSFEVLYVGHANRPRVG